jgi:hemerythrin-like metal-binding protein
MRKWDESLSVGIKLMDLQHEMLLNVIAVVSEALTEEKYDLAVEKFELLVNYTEYHFYEEEKLMMREAYPDISEHKIMHIEIMNKVHSYGKDLESGDFSEAKEIVEFLESWLVNHIKGQDKKYGAMIGQGKICNKKKNVIIIGGVAGGASCAARLRRMDEFVNITMLERGEFVSFANCGLPYHIGGDIEERDDLILQTPESFKKRFNVDVLTLSEATDINRREKIVTYKNVISGKEVKLDYDYVLLAPGARAIPLGVEGEDLDGIFHIKNIADMDRIIQYIDVKKVKSALVVGGGFIGIEMAENFTHKGIKTSLLQRSSKILGHIDKEMSSYALLELKNKGVNVELNTSIEKIEPGLNSSLLRVTLNDGRVLDTDLIILAVGVKPETTLAQKAGLALGEFGGIKVDNYFRTSDPKILAVGDVIETPCRVLWTLKKNPLAGPANRQGRMAADVISEKRPNPYSGVMGSSILKVFDLAIAFTGVSEEYCKSMDIDHDVTWIHSKSHASYYPGAKNLTLKIIYDPSYGRILGAQCVGYGGVDKRIDILALAMAGKLTVFDLEMIDFAYSPPFSSAKDAVNHICAVTANKFRKDHQTCRYDEVEELVSAGYQVVDVRSKDEYETGNIPGSINISVDDIRDNLEKFSKKSKYIVLCQVGVRGYIAQRILHQRGYHARNLLGGHSLWATVRQFYSI